MANPEVRGAGLPGRGASALGVVVRCTTFFAGFLVGCVLVIRCAELALGALQLSPVATDLSFVAPLRAWSRAVARDQRHLRVALFGDSKLLGHSDQPDVSHTTERALRAIGGRAAAVKIYDLTWPGASVPAEYCVADEMIDAHPDLVVLEVNLHFLGPVSPAVDKYGSLASLIRPPRLLEASLLPLSYTGLTLNRLLFYTFLDRIGARDAWAFLSERQARLFKLRDPFESLIEERATFFDGHNDYTDRRWAGMQGRLRRLLAPGRPRYNRAEAQKTFGNALEGISPGHPRLRILRATLEAYRRAGIRVLVWVPPLNVEQLQRLGFPTDGLDRTVAVMRHVVESSGASLLDSHALLPDTAFLDSGDHFPAQGTPNRAAVVGDVLGRAIADTLPSFPSPARSRPPRSHAVQ